MTTPPGHPAPIAPDDKDWTWVNDRPCPECGFDASTTQPTEVGALLRANVADWKQVLRLSSTRIRARPRPDRWSPLEYACHVRDVFVLYLERLNLMLAHDAPTYPNWDQDATALERRYDLADPAAVVEDLERAGLALADRFDEVGGDQWERAGIRSDGARFTVASFATYLAHDPIHHLVDVAGPD